jgi:hypothetical protein
MSTINVEQAVRQAIQCQSIAQTTIDSLLRSVKTCDDTRAIAILYDAIEDGSITVS